MGAAATATAATKTENRASRPRLADDSEWHLVDSPPRRPVAGLAHTLWPLVNRGQSFLSVASGEDLGAPLCRRASPGRCGGQDRLGSPLGRWHHGAGASAGGWRTKRDPEVEARGRSRGGFSTKGHGRAEGGGKLMTLILRPGQRHEARVFNQVMAHGAVKRMGPGRPKQRPHRIVGDNGDSRRQIRQ
jgi:hypothetical protein